MKLILLTMPDFFIEEHQILTALFDEGLELLHLRKPDSESVYLERLLTLIPETYRKRIVLHDHFYLKSEYNLAGIHLNNRNPLPPQNYKGQVSRSCHSAEEAVAAQAKGCTYVTAGHVFATRCKAGLPGRGLGFLKTVCRSVSVPVYAIGGISADNIDAVIQCGAKGACVMSGVMACEDVQRYLGELK